MKSSQTRTLFGCTTVLAALALSVAGCGGDNAEESSAGEESSAEGDTTTSAATTQDTTTQDTGGDAATSADCPPADGSATPTQQFDSAPPMCIDPTKPYAATIDTNMGPVEIELLTEQAPNTVNNFVVLSRYHYYDNTDCHRIIPDFMAQCGDPTGTGTGNPGYSFADELPEAGQYVRGAVAMANAGPNTQGAQFFIVTGDGAQHLPPDYTLFGKVTGGLDDALVAIDAAGNPDPAANGMPPAQPVTIESITITE